MHGDISLESKLGVGTQAMFWIPFKKAEQNPNALSSVDMNQIPDRLQSDLSVSCDSSEHATPQIVPMARALQFGEKFVRERSSDVSTVKGTRALTSDKGYHVRDREEGDQRHGS